MIASIAILITCLKALLIPTYKSTDFEVHRNWLAVTHSLPLKKWYFDNTSQWTLDYPPLFAYFEYVLSMVAAYFDKEMLNIHNIDYSSHSTVLFQRLSVIMTDLVFVYGVAMTSKVTSKKWRSDIVLPVLLLTNFGLLIVDHIHFQYNGLLFGVLLISVANMIKENYIQSAIWFSILLNMKHIYLYIAPVYFIYILKHYVEFNNIFKSTSSVLWKLLNVASIVIIIFVLSFAPFYDHLPQVFGRLFPFKRGLCHAYWAPNFWVIYNILDKMASKLLILMGYSIDYKVASMTQGLVQEYSHTTLPNITPLVTVMVTIALMLPILGKLYIRQKSSIYFLRSLVLCGLTSFLFGWHVHEKAILIVIIPLTILSIMTKFDAVFFLLLSTAGHYSLLPLLFPNSLLVLKAVLISLFVIYSFHSLYQMYYFKTEILTLPLLNRIESLYILGFIPLFMYENIFHFLFGIDYILPFLPLLTTSFYCSISIIYCWLKMYISFIRTK